MSRPALRLAAAILTIAAMLLALLVAGPATARRSRHASASAGHHHHPGHGRHARRKARIHKKHHNKKTPPPTEPPTSPPPGNGEETPGAGSAVNPFASLPVYVEPGSPAELTAAEWKSQGRSTEAAQIEKIARQPVAKWFGDWTYGHGGTEGDVNWWVTSAGAAKALPLLVAYNLPWRDCSQYSSGGAASPTAYKRFIDEMAEGIGARTAAVILEPDALAEMGCLSAERQASYESLLSYAVTTLGHNAGTTVYLDAGHAGWQPPATIASRLAAAGVAHARGFSLNVSNYDPSPTEIAYGKEIVSALGTSSHFVVDTSRNGQGAAPGGAWCNPPGRGLGTPPSSATADAAVDAFLWVKHPGTSDGSCNGGPAAGTWWPANALELAQNSAG